ncbi:hypothetical protein Q8A73_013483 [Channa argus]|nr:hypothetical protein Q8A73_013483 [Channa argus]
MANIKCDESEDNTELMKLPSSFTPEVQTESAKVSYRHRCLLCLRRQSCCTALSNDKSLLQSAGKIPPGLLFDIKCSEDAVCQFQVPHCETEDALLSNGLLSVVHISDEGMSILELLEITDTHVVVKVPHLSTFGLVCYRHCATPFQKAKFDLEFGPNYH